jgi:glutathione S-transferase
LLDWTGHLEIVHATLSPYLLGAKLSAADIYLYMLTSWYPLDDSALASRLPKVRQHAELLRHRPATRKAEKDHSDS